MLSRYFQSLTNTYPVDEEKKMTSHFHNTRILNEQKVKFGWSCPLTGHYFDPCFVEGPYGQSQKTLNNFTNQIQDL